MSICLERDRPDHRRLLNQEAQCAGLHLHDCLWRAQVQRECGECVEAGH